MMKRKEIILFLILTFLFSWIIWGSALLLITLKYKVSGVLLISLITLGSFGPSIIGVILTIYFGGKVEVTKLFKRLTIYKFKPWLYIFVILLCPIVMTLSIFIHNLLGGNLNYFNSINPIQIILVFIFILILGGPLGEEIGWRGFVLARLQKTNSSVKSAMILGVIWAIWHIPLFFLKGSSQYGFPYGIFFVNTIAFSIIIAYVLNKSGESLFLSMLFHGAFNTSLSCINIMPQITHTLRPIIIAIFILWIICIIMIRFFKPNENSLVIKNHNF